MAFLALVIVERSIRRLAVFLAVVFVNGEMLDNVLYAVDGFGKEEVEGFVGSR